MSAGGAASATNSLDPIGVARVGPASGVRGLRVWIPMLEDQMAKEIRII